MSTNCLSRKTFCRVAQKAVALRACLGCSILKMAIALMGEAREAGASDEAFLSGARERGTYRTPCRPHQPQYLVVGGEFSTKSSILLTTDFCEGNVRFVL